MKSSITTHVLDTSSGRPAAGIPVHLEIQDPSGGWKKLGSGTTDSDGRVNNPIDGGRTIQPGTYRLTFETASYFQSRSATSFYPFVHIVFRIEDSSSHYHVPLLLSPFGYSTYRGS